jgi:hypothetical protein
MFRRTDTLPAPRTSFSPRRIKCSLIIVRGYLRTGEKGQVCLFQIILAHNNTPFPYASVPSMIPMSLQVGNLIGPKYRSVSQPLIGPQSQTTHDYWTFSGYYIYRSPVLAQGQRSRLCSCPMHAACSPHPPDHSTSRLAVGGIYDTCVLPYPDVAFSQNAVEVRLNASVDASRLDVIV